MSVAHGSGTYAVILAGGVGNRFMPYSTPERPKQFLHITDPATTMIQMTFDRISSMLPAANVFVSTNDRYVDLVREQLPDVPIHNIIGEPKKKNTAPAIGLLNEFIRRKDPDAVTFFLPADHFIAHTSAALDAYARAAELAREREALITFGIVPTFPSPDYGYIRRGESLHASGAHAVDAFVEKPDEATAASYIATGNYFWNGGMFVWHADTLKSALHKHMPDMNHQLRTLKIDKGGSINSQWLEWFFDMALGTSIDYGVMEKAALTGGVMTFPFDAGWSDVGTWKGLSNLASRFDLDLPAVVKRHLAEQLPLGT